MAVTKKRIRKTFEAGKVYIRALYNNTIVTLTDPDGNVLAWSSPGANGFKGARQSTPYAVKFLQKRWPRKRKLSECKPLT